MLSYDKLNIQNLLLGIQILDLSILSTDDDMIERKFLIIVSLSSWFLRLEKLNN